MTKPESATDPWKAIQRYEFVQTNFAYTTDHEMERDAEGEWARWEAVDAARAAEAAQHRHEIAAIAGCDGQCSCAIFTRHDAAMALFKEMDEVKALSAALAAVEAERDKQAEQIADLTMHKASRDSQLGCLLEDIGGKKYPTMNEARDQIAAWKAIRAERDRLLSEVEQAVTAFKCGVCGVVHLPSTYNEGTKTGWAECFYRGERDRLKAALERLRDCDWTIGRGGRMDAVRDIARAALTPQGQSTDGETR